MSSVPHKGSRPGLSWHSSLRPVLGCQNCSQSSTELRVWEQQRNAAAVCILQKYDCLMKSASSTKSCTLYQKNIMLSLMLLSVFVHLFQMLWNTRDLLLQAASKLFFFYRGIHPNLSSPASIKHKREPEDMGQLFIGCESAFGVAASKAFLDAYAAYHWGRTSPDFPRICLRY